MEQGVYAVCGLLIGVLVGWLLRTVKRVPPDTRVEDELRLQRDAQSNDLAKAQSALIEATNKCAALETAKCALTEQLGAERLRIDTMQSKLQTDFEAVSNRLLMDNTKKFNVQSAEELGKLLAPFKQDVEALKSSLEQTRKETSTHSAVLKDQISRIGTEAANLSKALQGDVKILGNWGEDMLDLILEKSGLEQGLHYRTQQGAKGELGEQRFLDVVVDLPEKRNLVIDSKVSLGSYKQAVNASGSEEQEFHLTAHVKALRDHFRGLGAKKYHRLYDITAPDFVLMYVPIEGAFALAVAREPELFAEALDANVVMVTNSTLLATLRTVAHVWRLAEQQKNAIEIADRGGRLYDKFANFVADLEDVRKALAGAQSALESADKKLYSGTGSLLWQAEQLKALKVKASKSIPAGVLERAEQNALGVSQSTSNDDAPARP